MSCGFLGGLLKVVATFVAENLVWAGGGVFQN
jgi:hypothetical protein